MCNQPLSWLVFSSSASPAPPSVKILLDDPVVVNPGETITLVCKVMGGHPFPTLRWLRLEDEELPRRAIVKDGTLTVPVISDDDGGTYNCVASNNVGNPAKKFITILVRGMTVTFCSNRSLLFELYSRRSLAPSKHLSVGTSPFTGGWTLELILKGRWPQFHIVLGLKVHYK